jgi:hypothetical protein
MKIKPSALRGVYFLAGFLFYPFFVEIFATIHINIPGGWQAVVVGDNLAFNIVFSVISQPPKIFGVIHNRNGVSVWPWRLRGLRSNPQARREHASS